MAGDWSVLFLSIICIILLRVSSSHKRLWFKIKPFELLFRSLKVISGGFWALLQLTTSHWQVLWDKTGGAVCYLVVSTLNHLQGISTCLFILLFILLLLLLLLLLPSVHTLLLFTSTNMDTHSTQTLPCIYSTALESPWDQVMDNNVVHSGHSAEETQDPQKPTLG